MLIQCQRNHTGWDLLRRQCVQFGVLSRTRALRTCTKSACNFHQGFYIFTCTEMWTFWSPVTCGRVAFLVLNAGHDQHPLHSGHIADISHSQSRRGKLSGRRRRSCLGRRPSKQGRHNDEHPWEEGVWGGWMPPWGKGRGEGVAPRPLDRDKGEAEVHVSAPASSGHQKRAWIDRVQWWFPRTFVTDDSSVSQATTVHAARLFSGRVQISYLPGAEPLASPVNTLILS